MSTELYQQFKSTFVLPFFAQKWQARFEQLHHKQQQAIVTLRQSGIDCAYIFREIEKIHPEDLTPDRFDKTVQGIYGDYFL